MNEGKERLLSWSVFCLSGLGEPLPLFWLIPTIFIGFI
jgi:hypothetical protein